MHALLAARSDLSLGESILTVDRLIEQAKETGASAVALTDTMSVTALADFTNRAKKADIKPIIGARLRLVDDPLWRKPKAGEPKQKTPRDYFITAYAATEAGLKALFRLLTLANSQERFYYYGKLGFEDLYKELGRLERDDLILATGDAYSLLHHPDAEAHAMRMATLTQTYLQITPINTPLYDTLNRIACEISQRTSIETIVLRPALYARDEADPHEIGLAIAKGDEVASTFARAPAFRDAHPVANKELVNECKALIDRLTAIRGCTFAGVKVLQGLKNTDALVAKVGYQWAKWPVSLPIMAPDEFDKVRTECIAGWSKRFGAQVFGHKPDVKELADVYRPRLAYELNVLRTLKFSGYFLLVQDVVRFAKDNGILVGPGRGSVGGSLVAYLMGITDCDPIRFGLLFERFINPDRIDLPDADLDFMSERRGEVVDYIVNKFGSNRVAGVSNFNTLGPASTIRDVAKACGLPESEYRCSKTVPAKHGQSVELKDAADQAPEIGAFRDKHPEIWDVCLKIEGVTRSMGQHAAGVVVGGCDLVERAVIEKRKADMGVVCWDKRQVESMGLVKMDLLGLTNLDLIDLTLKFIRKRHSKKINLLQIPLDDPKVLDNFAKALTTGVFQFESGGLRRLLKELGKDGVITFDDITAATALYRPGPMESGMMDSYWKRKQGIEAIEYDHPDMEPILKPTFGVMVFQEQVMQVARTIAGYTAPDADKLRKIMGKKLPEEMKKERGKFVDGCVATVFCDPGWAGDLFDKIEGFAGYGFNKSHSVTYTLISYQTMYLKTYYAVEFIAAALTLMKDDKLPGLLKDAHRLGIEVELPEINTAGSEFEILTDTRLMIPFARVKGLSTKAAEEIVEKRTAGGKFTSMADFETRCRSRLVHKGKIETLDAVGAFAAIVPGSLPINHPDRVLAQREFIPGLISATVPVDREIASDKYTKAKLIDLIGRYKMECEDDGVAASPTFGKNARFMVISDGPTRGEEDVGKFAYGKQFDSISTALVANGLSRADVYWTGLLKRPKEGKQPSPEEIARYAPYLNEELELLKPPVIVLLGATVSRHFLPDLKGKASESAGKIVYSKELEANLVIGFSPGEIWHDPDKQTLMNEVFAVAASLTE